MVVYMEAFLRRLRRAFSRSEWLVKLLNLAKMRGEPNRPGLVMIQIDGLGLEHFERAIKEGRMPFLDRLRREEGYKQYRQYPGIPSNTPAVQGALFYGVKACIPAFHYRDKRSGELRMLFQPSSAAAVQKSLEEKSGAPGLLDGGSAYGDIFTGGAKEAHFCAAGVGWGSLLKAVNPLGFPLTILLNLHVITRALVFLLIEFVFAVWDCLRGILAGRNIKKELMHIPLRVIVCVVMRDISTTGAKIDVARGLPVVHVNLAGFDEQAHRRGPDSRFAMWSLRGIDSSIRRIYDAARSSGQREYDVFVYSDHGQEDVQPYRTEYGRTVQEAVTEIFKEKIEAAKWRMDFARARHEGRASLLRGPERRLLARAVPTPPAKEAEKTLDVVVTAMGPLGHIYTPVPLTPDEKAKIAEALVTTAKIPFAMIPEGPGQATAWTAKGRFSLPAEGEEVLDPKHPFFEKVVRDMVEICHHEDAGEIVIWGWRDRGLKPITFMGEHGSHAGPGPVETCGFALLPVDALPRTTGDVIEPLDLRHAAQRSLAREQEGLYCEIGATTTTVRLMTYNVHGCMGRDGKVSPGRIARIIARHNPDIVCLQELDTNELVHQAEAIAKKLEMEFHYFSALKKERRGNVIFSRRPIKLVKSGPLPRMMNTRLLEPRGAIWVEIDVCGTKLNLLNTHLSLSPKEALLQTEAILGEDWFGALKGEKGPVIICGDFNSDTGSLVCRTICGKFKNAQAELKGHRVLNTMPSYLPLRAIDHVFISRGIKVHKVETPKTELERVSSDHLPFIVEIEIEGVERA